MCEKLLGEKHWYFKGEIPLCVKGGIVEKPKRNTWERKNQGCVDVAYRAAFLALGFIKVWEMNITAIFR